MTEAVQDEMVPMWPVGTPQSYIDARVELAKAERALRDQVEELAAARRRLPDGALMRDYELTEGPIDLGLDEPVGITRLSELFGEQDKLVIYHLMYHPDDDEACPMCSLWVDGFHGISRHLSQHAAFAVVGKAPLAKLRDWARRRGWDGLRILSSQDTSFNEDLRAESASGDQRPMVSVFTRAGSQVRHFYTLPANYLDDTQRGFDILSPLWNLLDLMPDGRGEWYAENGYAGRLRG
jgi:predicted dithiol-disulfide oxidoreductase (DUF899 family)